MSRTWKTAKKKPKSYQEILWYANSFIELSEYDKAEIYYSMLVEKAPYTVKNYELRANFFENKKEYGKVTPDYEKVISDYSTLIKLRPKKVEYYIKRGIAYFKIKEYQKAFQDFTIALQKKPDAVVYYYLGQCHYKFRNKLLAWRYYEAANSMDANFIDAYIGKAKILVSEKKLDKALLELEKVRKEDDEYYKVYLLRANVYFHKEQYKRALKECTKAIGLNKKYKEAYKFRIDIYERLKRENWNLFDKIYHRGDMINRIYYIYEGKIGKDKKELDEY